MNTKQKNRIGTGLYIVAIVLLLIHLYQKGADIENRFFDVAGWIALLMAGGYQIWSKGKAKIKE